MTDNPKWDISRIDEVLAAETEANATWLNRNFGPDLDALPSDTEVSAISDEHVSDEALLLRMDRSLIDFKQLIPGGPEVPVIEEGCFCEFAQALDDFEHGARLMQYYEETTRDEDRIAPEPTANNLYLIASAFWQLRQIRHNPASRIRDCVVDMVDSPHLAVPIGRLSVLIQELQRGYIQIMDATGRFEITPGVAAFLQKFEESLYLPPDTSPVDPE